MDRLRSSGGWTDSGVMVGGQTPREYTHKENFIELHSYGGHALSLNDRHTATAHGPSGRTRASAPELHPVPCDHKECGESLKQGRHRTCVH